MELWGCLTPWFRHCHQQTYRIMHDLPWITIFLVTSQAICQWFSLGTEVTSENHWQIASGVTPNNRYLSIVMNVLFYFLQAILCPEHTVPLKAIIDRSFRHCHRGRFFWLSIVSSPQLICDVTLTRATGIVTSYSSIVLVHANCMVQKRYSLVNNNHEYWFLTTRYSWLSR